MLKKNFIVIFISLLFAVKFYSQNKKEKTFLVDFKIDCKIEEKPFFEFQTVYLTDILETENEIQYLFYSNGIEYKVSSEFLNVQDSIKYSLKEIVNEEKDSLIKHSKSNSYQIEKLEKDLAIINYEKIKRFPIALSFYSYYDTENHKIIGKRLYFNLSKKSIKKIKLKANGYDENGKYLGSKIMIQNQIIEPKKSFKFNPIPWTDSNLNKVELNEITIEYNDGTKNIIKDKNIPGVKYYHLYLLFKENAILKN